MNLKIRQIHSDVIKVYFKTEDEACHRKIKTTLRCEIVFYFIHLLVKSPSYAQHFQNYHQCVAVIILISDVISAPLDYKS